jgi:hypothetical protein
MSTYGDSVKLLESLPPRSVVLDCDMDAWQKDDDGLWTCTVRVDNSHAMGAESVALMGLLKVIYVGAPDVEIRSRGND